ncbi:MAG: DNA mismatch repair protein [Alphaproteobacteria bacterium]|nr:DNA mismatch repair protein [Alphaproteobacteria bacterium]
MFIYKNRQEDNSKIYYQLNKKYTSISLVRLLVAIAILLLIFCFFKSKNFLFIALGIAAMLVFFLLMKMHSKIAEKRKFIKELITINANELAYLNHEGIPFDQGTDYITLKHFYAHDLDIFGTNSLFHNLNRTATYIGKHTLAQLLLNPLKHSAINRNQAAVQELHTKLDFRHTILAFATLMKDNSNNYQELLDWAEIKPQKLTKTLQITSWITPLLFILFVIMYLDTKNALYNYLATLVFLTNLGLLLSQFHKIKQDLFKSNKIIETLNQYAHIFQIIENESFKSDKLLEMKQQLYHNAQPASVHIKKLNVLIANIQSIQNGFAALLFNGIFLYHIHVLKSLLHWKSENSIQISTWLNIVGEVEALNSLANFSYNNPEFVFPTLNNNFHLDFENLGHPLISKHKRVCNNIRFNKHDFVVLSGSNMSGKSTFLRTLGINMILGGIGSAICSSQATIHPMPVLVSMRQTDSLHDSTSYFFAEISRLKFIINTLQSQTCFVLLDELLKGTNSDDKQFGTIEIIKKIFTLKAMGSIATHDLEVCVSSNYLPHAIINKCFEVEIVNNDLFFDYKLKEGVCKNKSATFLMKKMEII